jgi:RNA-directed DNA polymerase
MAKTHKYLWQQVASLSNLMQAANLAMRGKRSLAPAAGFFAEWELECVNLAEELENSSYRPGAYRYFKIYEPKERIVAAAPFRDRVVHHALVRVLEPLFEPRFLEDSFACRKGKGTHAGMRRALHFARRHPYALKCDLRRYFPSIDHGILTGEIARVVADARVMDLIGKILASHRDGVRRVYGNELFDFTDHPRGLPIGNLTSQFFANIHLDRFDHFVKQELRVPGYVRYVDDFLLFGPDRATLHRWGRQCRDYLTARRMEIHPDKYRLCHTAEGVDFCGFVVRADGRVKLRTRGVRRFRRRFLKLKHEWKAGRAEAADLRDAVRAWVAHASHAHTWRLRGKVLAP